MRISVSLVNYLSHEGDQQARRIMHQWEQTPSPSHTEIHFEPETGFSLRHNPSPTRMPPVSAVGHTFPRGNPTLVGLNAVLMGTLDDPFMDIIITDDDGEID